MECFPLATAPVSQARRRRVSFADEVTTLNEEEINMLNADESPEVPPVSPPLTLPVVMEEAAVVSKTGPTPLIMPVVERIEYDSPAAEPVEIQTIMPESGVLPPPGFPPFLFPENDGGIDADDICARFGGLASLKFAQIGRESPDIPDETDVPEAGVSLRPSLDSSSEAIPTVGYAQMPLPSVDNSVMPELVWMPPVPRPAVRAVDREVAIPRWRLAREGPFLEERSAESMRSLGPGCAFRNTSYRVSEYAEPAGEYGLLLNHPRFVEWIGVPQSAGLLELSGRQWVDKLSRDQAVAAAVHLQRDVGLKQTNVDVLDQYALSLQKAASRIIDRCLGPCEYPAAEVATGALGPRVRRAAYQMESMGLWRPSLDPLRLH